MLVLTYELSNKMNFDYYFQATEESFATEKQEMLDRIDELRNHWEEIIQLDRSTSQKCDELCELKNMLSKNHLQILRTREEMLNAKFLNCKLQFLNRLLQNEIYRLLPYADEGSSTIDYKISLDLENYGKANKMKIQPDEKFKKELESIYKEWIELTAIQKQVIEEEKGVREKDEEYFQNFFADYQLQNEHAHDTIDSRLDTLLHKIVIEQTANHESSSQQKSIIQALEKKKELLAAKSIELEKQSEEDINREREKAKKKSEHLCGAARERIRNIEKANIKRYNDLKSQDTELRNLQKAKQESVRKLNIRYQKLKKNKAGFLHEGKGQIDKLESQLNALLTAATAMTLCPEFEHQYIIRAVSSAVDRHADTVQNFEEMSLKVQNMGNQINQLKQVFST